MEPDKIESREDRRYDPLFLELLKIKSRLEAGTSNGREACSQALSLPGAFAFRGEIKRDAICVKWSETLQNPLHLSQCHCIL